MKIFSKDQLIVAAVMVVTIGVGYVTNQSLIGLFSPLVGIGVLLIVRLFRARGRP